MKILMSHSKINFITLKDAIKALKIQQMLMQMQMLKKIMIHKMQ